MQVSEGLRHSASILHLPAQMNSSLFMEKINKKITFTKYMVEVCKSMSLRKIAVKTINPIIKILK